MTFWAVSSQLMKHRSTNTTLKRSGKMHDGRLPFFDIRGIVHYEILPKGQTVNQFYHLELLERLREKDGMTRIFCQHLIGLASRKCTCSHGTDGEGVLATKPITVLEHPAYSPDQAPSDFFLVPMIKEILKGRHFDDIDDIRNNTMASLKAIPQNQFQNNLKGGLGAGVDM